MNLQCIPWNYVPPPILSLTSRDSIIFISSKKDTGTSVIDSNIATINDW